MKTTKLILVLAIAFLFSASYIVKASALTNKNLGSASGDSTMTNHNHSGSSVMNGNQDGSMMMNHNLGDSTMMNHGNMMAMMQKCQGMCDKMSNVKSDNSFVDPGTKKGSYGYFQYQRQKDNAGKEKK